MVARIYEESGTPSNDTGPGRQQPVIEVLRPTRELHLARDAPPFPVGELLAANAGPFDLTVEVKHDDRVVGHWGIECNPRDKAGVIVSHARAELYLCGSAAGIARETGAFLAVTNWWVNAQDAAQLAALYEMLSVKTIVRLTALIGEAASPRSGARPELILYLLDERRRDRRALNLAALEEAMLIELAREKALAGIDLKVAHGRGEGSSPPVDAASAPTRSRPVGAGAATGKAFVPETVSPANVKWNRRSTDRPIVTRDPDAVTTAFPTTQ